MLPYISRVSCKMSRHYLKLMLLQGIMFIRIKSFAGKISEISLLFTLFQLLFLNTLLKLAFAWCSSLLVCLLVSLAFGSGPQ